MNFKDEDLEALQDELGCVSAPQEKEKEKKKKKKIVASVSSPAIEKETNELFDELFSPLTVSSKKEPTKNTKSDDDHDADRNELYSKKDSAKDNAELFGEEPQKNEKNEKKEKDEKKEEDEKLKVYQTGELVSFSQMDSIMWDHDVRTELDDKEKVFEEVEEIVHIRVQMRNGRKCITTVQGLNPLIDMEKILKVARKTFCCNGSMQNDKLMGKVIQLQGDQRKVMSDMLIDEGIVKKENIKIHGF